MGSSEDKQGGIYVASRVSRADVWKNLRDNMGVSITSSWIDEAGEGDTDDFGELWTRITREIAASTGLVFYGHTADQPWKGALVEVGIALALGKPVAALILGELEGRTMRPVGSWLHHPLVRRFTYMEDAIEYAQSGAPQSSCAASEGWRSMDEPLEYITKSDDPNIQFVNRVEMPKHARGWKLALPESEALTINAGETAASRTGGSGPGSGRGRRTTPRP